MTTPLSLAAIARAVDGKVLRRRQGVVAPWPGREFRQIVIRLHPLAPGGWIAVPQPPGSGSLRFCREYVEACLHEIEAPR